MNSCVSNGLFHLLEAHGGKQCKGERVYVQEQRAALEQQRRDGEKRSAQSKFYMCCKAGWGVEVAAGLASKRIDPNGGGEDGFTPLHTAAEAGHPGVVMLLLNDERVQVNARTTYGDTPLYLAVVNKRLEVVSLLLACERVDPTLTVREMSIPYVAFQMGMADLAAALNVAVVEYSLRQTLENLGSISSLLEQTEKMGEQTSAPLMNSHRRMMAFAEAQLLRLRHMRVTVPEGGLAAQVRAKEGEAREKGRCSMCMEEKVTCLVRAEAEVQVRESLGREEKKQRRVKKQQSEAGRATGAESVPHETQEAIVDEISSWRTSLPSTLCVNCETSIVGFQWECLERTS
uniref:Uncharacterized protein n=1 Tax=Chromera velia CCMP2878 TaxID=1169474 RepID=A0A0G4F0N7_9ALVE|eukprot:Cvel_14538.t1-p1 / transcript=Cvel_14538.t1 / gene=Cvel_14538 / organism=Chromera_velia_CCMP2878 / gene_product=Delta-latroinsectotoxin-Lt1a, putative / transcript_product=Delta-latroinsectotoxin-Lt1a, putative / location=Cvel_scaffold1038:34780-36055(-) / protein_length=344 / sequence_SO=supercontig / SO=protein_coding / is_pseudo=false